MSDGAERTRSLNIPLSPSLFSFVLAFVVATTGGVLSYAYLSAQVNETSRTVEKLGVRIDAVEGAAAKYDNVAYRTTVLEQSFQTMGASIKDLQAAVNSLSSDNRVALEILKRIEARGQKDAPQ